MENLFATLLLLHYGLLLYQIPGAPNRVVESLADIRILSGFRVIDVSHLKYPFGRGPIFLRLTIKGLLLDCVYKDGLVPWLPSGTVLVSKNIGGSHQLIRSDVIDLMGQLMDLILPTRLQKVTPPGGYDYPLLDNGN